MYSKEDQLKSNRIKPKKASTFGNRKPIKKKRNTNDEELAFLNWLHEFEQMRKYKCFVCGSCVEHYHHVKRDSTDKKNHFRVIPLCNEHHLGSVISPHGTPRKWRETYTMTKQLAKSLELQIDWKETL